MDGPIAERPTPAGDRQMQGVVLASGGEGAAAGSARAEQFPWLVDGLRDSSEGRDMGRAAGGCRMATVLCS